MVENSVLRDSSYGHAVWIEMSRFSREAPFPHMYLNRQYEADIIKDV